MKNKQSTFICRSWLGIGVGDGQIDQIFTAYKNEIVKDIETLFLANASKGIADDHIWFSILLRPPRNQFTRCQRVSCCLSALLFTMLANAMFYQTDKVVRATIDLGSFKFSWTQIMIGIQSAFIIFPINLFIATLFRKFATRRFEAESKMPMTEKSGDLGAISNASKRNTRMIKNSASNENNGAELFDKNQLEGIKEQEEIDTNFRGTRLNSGISNPTLEMIALLNRDGSQTGDKKRPSTFVRFGHLGVDDSLSRREEIIYNYCPSSSKNETATLKAKSGHPSKAHMIKPEKAKSSTGTLDHKPLSNDNKFPLQQKKNTNFFPDISVQGPSNDIITESAIILNVEDGTNSIGESCFYLLNAFSVFQSFFFQRDELCLFF